MSLDNATLDLLQVLDIDVAPHGHRNKGKTQDSRAADEHHPLCIAVGVLDSLPDRSTLGIRELHRERAVDGGEIGLRLFGEVLAQCLRENSLPDGGGDGEADAAADAREHALDGDDDGDVLVRDGGHGGGLLTDDDGAAGKGNEDLAHDDVADVDVGLSELEHQANTENRKGDAEEETDLLELSGATDPETDDERPEAGTDRVDIDHVARLGHVKTGNDLQE